MEKAEGEDRHSANYRKRTKSELSLTPSPASQNPRKVLRMSLENMEMESRLQELPTEWSSLTESEKLDKIMQKIMVIDSVEKKVDLLYSEYKTESDLHLKVSSLEGKNHRLEKKVEQLSKQVEELQCRTMRENLVFHNLKEIRGENCELMITDFLKRQMRIESTNIYSQENISGEIRIDVAHRLGKKNSSSETPRPVVVSFVTRKGREMVLKNAKNLKGKPQYVTEQLPSGMRERRLAQRDRMKELRTNNPDRIQHKIHFVRDILLHNGKRVDAQFDYNVLPPLDVVPYEYNNLYHTEPVQLDGSTFQGHVKSVSSVEDAVMARNALFQSDAIATAEHIMYAYRIDNEDGIFVTGNSDDGEWNGSSILVDLLDNLKMDNIFLAVSRLHRGPNLGKRRFQLIKQAGEAALQLI